MYALGSKLNELNKDKFTWFIYSIENYSWIDNNNSNIQKTIKQTHCKFFWTKIIWSRDHTKTLELKRLEVPKLWLLIDVVEGGKNQVLKNLTIEITV